MDCREDANLFRSLEKRSDVMSRICEKMEWNIDNVIKLSDQELCDFSHDMKEVLIDTQKVFLDQSNETNSNTKGESMSLKQIDTIVRMGTLIISQRSCVPYSMVETAIILHSTTFPNINDEKVKDEISKFLEKWWILNLAQREKIIVNVLKYLIQAARTSVRHIRRLCAVKNALRALKNASDIREILKLSREAKCLSLKEGRELVLHFFTFGEQWILGIHNNIKAAMESAEPSTVSMYGELYVTAWEAATDENKIVITEKCLQDIVFHSLRVHRDADNLGTLAKNLFAFVGYVIEHANDVLKKMFSDRYMPLVWKHLKAPGCLVRCNAADILFLAYPVQPYGIKRRKNNGHLSKQHEAMTNLLKDPDHRVCHVAVKGVLNVMAKHWVDIPESVTGEWLKFCLDCTKNSSYPELRASIFHGFKLTLSNPHSVVAMRENLPKFSNTIYDENAKVKIAFIKLLLQVKRKTEIQLWDIISLSNLLDCLESESSNATTELIVKLLWPTIFPSEEPLQATKQISRFALINVRATRKLFMHCKHMVDFDMALELIRTILLTLREYVKKASSTKSSRDGHILSAKRESDDDSLDNPLVTQTLFDVAAIVWTISSEEFVKENRKEDLENLKSIAADALPHFYNHFKGTSVNESIMFLCSLMPESLLSDSTRFSRICIRELHDPSASDDTVLTVIYLLIKWKRMDKILKLLRKLFAVPVHNVAPSSSPKRRKLLQDSMFAEEMLGLGLRILKHLYSEFESVLINNHHCSLVEVWKSLDFVQQLIVTRLDESTKKVCYISERMLESLFRNYVSLIPLLDKNDVFDASENFGKVLCWVRGNVVPHISRAGTIENDTFPVNLLKTIFGVGNEMVPRFQATPKLCCTIVLLYSECLTIPNGIIFVNEALVTMSVLMQFNSVAFEKDESNLLSVVIPSFLTAVMVTLTKYSVDVVAEYTDNLKSLPSILYKSFLIVERSTDRCVLNAAYMSIIVATVVACISKELHEHLREDAAEEANLLDVEIPYVSERLLKIVLRGEKLRRLFLAILEKSVETYTPAGLISVLLIVYKMARTKSKLPMNELKLITLKAGACGMNDSSETPFGRVIERTRRRMIEAILRLL